MNMTHTLNLDGRCGRFKFVGIVEDLFLKLEGGEGTEVDAGGDIDSISDRPLVFVSSFSGIKVQ